MPKRRSSGSSEQGFYLKIGLLAAVLILLLIFGLWSMAQSPDAMQ